MLAWKNKLVDDELRRGVRLENAWAKVDQKLSKDVFENLKKCRPVLLFVASTKNISIYAVLPTHVMMHVRSPLTHAMYLHTVACCHASVRFGGYTSVWLLRPFSQNSIFLSQ
jgi:hypothetical protein